MKPVLSQICREGLAGLRNLGFSGTVVVGTLALVLAAYLGDACIVVVTHGPRAFFFEGLRVVDWKQGILSNGEELSLSSNLAKGFLAMCFWAVIMICAELLAWGASIRLNTSSKWLWLMVRLLGGVALITFALWYARDFYFIHPIPLCSFIAGIILVLQFLKVLFGEKGIRNQ